MPARRALPVLVAVALLALSACGDRSEPDPRPAPTAATTTAATPAASGYGRYVAIGDSYSAGPGIAPLDADSAACARSAADFPALLAERLRATLVDVGCSGATTQTATQGANGLTGTLDPQLDALGDDTALVTVLIGGNDGGLFQSLIQSCARAGATCAQYVRGQVPGVLSTTSDSVATLLDDVTDRAPDADVRLVGYLRLIPASGSCDALGVPAAAQELVRRAEADLDDALAAAASRADVTYVSMREASKGHDACAGDDAWTNGSTSADGDGIIFHPRAAGMRAVAAAVAATL
jgi:lysophospholipase L1-like esterase